MAGDGDEEMVEAEADDDAHSTDTEAHDAQVVDTEVHEAQVADTEVHDAQAAVTETQAADTEVHDIQNADAEMQEEMASEALESNPDHISDSDSAKEPCTTIEQNSPTTKQP